jgi:PPOX class probable F420-dependent enzyme
MTAMSQDRRLEFLTDLHVGVLAIERRDRSPLAVPIWYIVHDGAVEMTMGAESLKAKLLRRAGRATFTVQRESVPYAYVSVEGPVTVEPLTEQRPDIAIRYLGPERGAAYTSDVSESVLVRLTPQVWRSEDYSGDSDE